MPKSRLYKLPGIKTARSIAVQQLVRLEEERSRPGFDDDDSMQIDSAQEHRQVKEYVAGITRWKRRLDFILSSYYKGEYDKLEPVIVQLLRLGAYDLLYLSTPPHAAIHETVELAKSGIRPGAGGLVNGILRSVDRNRDQLPTPRKKIRAHALGVAHSHPNWMVYRWLKRFPEDIEALLEWNNTRPHYAVRINTRQQDVATFIGKLDEAGVEWEPGRYLEDFVRVSKLQPLVRQGWLRDGLCAVQDESSGLIVRLLDPQPGETIVDACAAPGGKTMYIASLMNGEGKLLAFDVQAERLTMLAQVKDRFDAGWVETRVEDLRKVSQLPQADRVLLDAPCSGLGVLAKRADLRWKRTLDDIKKITDLQVELLDAAASFVKPGGLLVYSTCTIAPEENEEQVKAFLKRHPAFEVESAAGILPEAVVSRRGYLATIPHRHKMDGVFGVRLRQAG